MRLFLGITGASGAPYAARLVEALAGADVELGVCASSAGIEVLATELYGNARLSRDETLARLKEQGIEPERPPYQVREGGSYLCFVRDPDGYRVEVIGR